MRGITLQYTEDDRVFFDDVAGVGDAKVSVPAPTEPAHCSLVLAAVPRPGCSLLL